MSLERLRQLEPKLRNYSDEEVTRIREKIYELAQLSYDSYREQSDSKFQLGSESMDGEK